MKGTFLLTIAIFLAGQSLTEGSKAFVLPRSKAVLEKQGPIETTTAAKCICGLWLAQDVTGILAPEMNLKTYGGDDASAANLTNQMLMTRSSLAVLSSGVLAFSSLFKYYSLNTAYALTASLWVAQYLHALLNDLSTKLQAPGKEGDLVGLTLASASLYGYLTDAGWALTAIKGFTGYLGLGEPSCAWVGYKNTTKIRKVGELENKEWGTIGLVLVSVCLLTAIMGLGGYVGLGELSCALLGYSNAAKKLKMGELHNVGKAVLGMVGNNSITLFIVAYTTAGEGRDIKLAIGRACLAGLFYVPHERD
jgi:hypothetical protein